jgi:hypothetical protein
MGGRRVRVYRSTISLRTTLTLLAVLVLGSGIGAVGAAAMPQGDGPGSGDPPAVPTGASPGAGLASIDLTRHTTRLVDGIPGTRGSVSVSCREGIVVGGGFSHVSSGLRVTGSRPHGIHSWRVSWTQTSTDDTAIYAYAVCMTTA